MTKYPRHERETIAQIKENLEKGFHYSTKATGMVNGGTHDWHYKNGHMSVFGSGPNWHDQDDSTNHDLDSAARALYHDKTRSGPFEWELTG
jgi:hypothetical protein